MAKSVVARRPPRQILTVSNDRSITLRFLHYERLKPDWAPALVAIVGDDRSDQNARGTPCRYLSWVRWREEQVLIAEGGFGSGAWLAGNRPAQSRQ